MLRYSALSWKPVSSKISCLLLSVSQSPKPSGHANASKPPMKKQRRQQEHTAITAPAAPAFRLPKALEKQGEALLEQQMWCWGCDVRRQEGNLLLAYGCERRASPDSRYH